MPPASPEPDSSPLGPSPTPAVGGDDALGTPPDIIPPASVEPPPLVTGAAPPLLTAPPVLPAVTPRLPGLLLAAVILAGVISLGLSLVTSTFGRGASSASYRLGAIVGGTLLWPAIVLGMFSIGRRFRTGQARAVILLVIWGISILGQLGTLVGRAAPRLPGPERGALLDSVARRQSATRSAEAPPAPRAPPLEVAETSAAAEFDFSSGSDQRLIESMSHAQGERYRRIVVGYRAACAMRPDDADLALAWVRFVEHFADAEDVVIESAATDLESARNYLESRFPHAPGTVLFVLDRTYGDEFKTKVAAYAARVARWPARDASKFHLLQAQHGNLVTNPAAVRGHAETSFRLHPTPEAGILVARASLASDRQSRAREVLQHAAFSHPPVRIEKQRMDLLFDLGEAEAAISVFEKLKTDAPGLVWNKETAVRLAKAGRVAEGRELLAARSAQGWNSAWIARQRFEFELDFGDATEAHRAYGELRGTGFAADPLGRERFALFRRQPAAPWSWTDVSGFLVFAGALLAAAMLPLLFFGPVHHWSLWRQSKGRAAAWSFSPWGLRAACIVAGVACVAETVAVWFFQPHAIRTWFDEGAFRASEATVAVLPAQILVWSVLGVTLVIALALARAWRLLGPGAWNFGKAIGIGFGVGLALRMAITLYVFAVPGIRSELAQISPVTTQLTREVLASLGPWGLILVIAVFVPLLEEILFRGVLLGALVKHIPFGAANTLQAVGFAALHENILLAPFFVVFALLAGALTRRSGGLLAAIVLHAVNNGIVCLGVIAMQARPPVFG